MQILKIKTIRKVPKTDRYDLTVNSTHNFFANGVLIHNTSAISAYVLCKQELNWKQKIAKWLTGEEFNKYDYLWSSRSVIKNKYYNKDVDGGYYDVDLWGIAHKIVQPTLSKGLTVYYEIIGYLPNGGYIQKDYDYGCEKPNGTSYIYDKHYNLYNTINSCSYCKFLRSFINRRFYYYYLDLV